MAAKSTKPNKTMAALKLAEPFRYIYGIAGMNYFIKKDTGEEYVRIFMPDGNDFDVNVTADSCSALVTDVVRELNRRLM